MDKKKEWEAAIRQKRVTYDIYAELPEDGQRYEVLDGSLELMSGPSLVHQMLGAKLHLITQSCSSEYFILLAPLDVILSPRNVAQPDVIFIHRGRTDIMTMRGIEGAPDLVVEVLSPGSRHRDKVRKLDIYGKHGVQEYWILDPVARTLERYEQEGNRLTLTELFEGEDRVVSDKLPCISFALSELFAEEQIGRLLAGG
ncbi:Endonuclease, Uma2 family (restriction endonuclease fold) [Cohnella sp. OV330]|uniref:Uma2 family endonuclease n=1 Tax=Cohnella sp. OV330 TaxID=1855288 RepID=UPI0008E0E0B5|nr:Uma2 family endonuclease [Cohnella sp. OV330]SFB07898.1 Endonuclease, Uma2 family (restriction endonuclease fold) [Cohnella sp. OV330]